MNGSRISKFVFILVLLSRLSFGQKPPTEFKLNNGLQVQLKSLAQGKTCALVVLYSVGNLHDPPGQSGLSHMAEHMYVTAATRATEMRTINEYARRYPSGFNAQTGDDYTVLATVFAPDQLNDEIDEAAERMTNVRITEEDLKRELPRLDLELTNMFGGLPNLAAPNIGQQTLVPLKEAGRRGGVIGQLKTVTSENLQSHLDSFYKPRNARLIIAGPMDVEETEKSVRRAFGKIESGLQLPAAQKPLLVKGAQRVTKSFTKSRFAVAPIVSVTYQAPLPTDRRYPAFLFAVTRMRQNAMAGLNTKPGQFPISYAPIDKPGFISISLRIPDKSTVAETQARIEQFVTAQIEREIDDGESNRVVLWNNGLLFLRPLPDAMIARNPYSYAFSYGRTAQLGMNKEALLADLEALGNEEFKRACRSIFDPDKRSLVVMVPKEHREK